MKQWALVGAIFSILALFIMSCGGKNFEEPGKVSSSTYDDNVTFSVSYDDTWEAITTVFNKYPILSSNKKERSIETDWIYGKSENLYSGYHVNRIPYNVRFKFYVMILPSKGSTKIKIASKEQFMSDVISAGSDIRGSIYQWVDTKPTTIRGYRILLETEEELKKIVSRK